MLPRACLVVLALCVSVLAALKPAPFGTLLGVTDGGVEVYSCQLPEGTEALDMDANYVDGVYTGVRWQCVELGRRYLYVNYGVVFGSIDNAYQIFDLPTFTRVATQSPVAITKRQNGYHEPPAHGSLLIWSPYGEMAVTGHVAVVVNATDTFVDIVEQNVEDTIWPKGQQYSRRLQVERNATSYFIKKWYDEEHIIGWITIDNAESSNLTENPSSSSLGSLFFASFIITVGAAGFMVYRQRSRRTDRYNQYNLVK